MQQLLAASDGKQKVATAKNQPKTESKDSQPDAERSYRFGNFAQPFPRLGGGPILADTQARVDADVVVELPIRLLASSPPTSI